MKMEENKNEAQFIDAESFSGGQDKTLTFKGIVLQHLNKILLLSCVEFRGGYSTTSLKMIGGAATSVENYVPDTRETYYNAVNSFYDILFPHLDPETIKTSEDIDKHLTKFHEECIINAEYGEEELFDQQRFRTEMLIYKRKLFRALNVFLKKNDYMKGRQFEEEA